MRHIVVWSVAAAAASCDPTIADYCAKGAPECTVLDGGTEGAVASDVAMSPEGGSEGGDGGTCDPSQTPSTSACVVVEAYGVFVAPAAAGGSDVTGNGTRAAPYSTLGHGIDAGQTAGKRVYVCAGTFGEPLVVGSSRDGAAIYGGLDCATWSYSAANRVIVAPAQTGFALEIDGLVTGATLNDLEFDALAASEPGQSSIAAFVQGSQQVAFVRVTLVASQGANGSAGASAGTSGDPSNLIADAGVLNGKSASSSAPGAANACQCLTDSTTSSTGGQGGSSSQNPNAGLPSYGDDAGAGAAGVNGVSCRGLGTGANGLGGPPGSADAPSAARGTVSATGWLPASGTAGSNGKSGQGGGGGSDGTSGGFGGGGACGGCGGAGGRPGGGGGASMALLVYQSTVALSGCTLTAASAGTGGAGGSGEPGQGGGIAGNAMSAGCQGGGGGAGASGNGAQGGPGGLSLGIGYSGTPPTFDGSAIAPAATLAGIIVSASKAAGGAQGLGGASTGLPSGADGAQGAVGVSQAVLAL